MIGDRMLTLQELDTAEPNSTLRSGVFTYFYNGPDEPIDCFYTAVRGEVHDWSLYASKIPDGEFMPEISKMDCADVGDKIYNKDLIRQIIECDDEAFALYRF